MGAISFFFSFRIATLYLSTGLLLLFGIEYPGCDEKEKAHHSLHFVANVKRAAVSQSSLAAEVWDQKNTCT